jgi:hypothetical protein
VRAASPLLARPGAVAAGAPDAGVALHYGDPVREQRALEAGRAVADLSHRGVVEVRGPDRLRWLHSLTSQALLDLSPGESRELLLLDPHGHVEHAAGLVDDGTSAWLLTEADDAPRLAAFLDSMRFMLRVDVTDATADRAVLGAATAAADALAAAAPGALVWRDPWPVTAPGGARYGPPDDEHPGTEHRTLLAVVPRPDLATVVAALEARGVEAAGTWAWEALRVAAWRPRLAREVDERALPHELDWLRTAVHLHKGCYRGQETIARVHNLGRPPRRLVFLHLDGSGHTLPERGEAVYAGGERAVGHLTSVARHYEDGPIALALVKRSTDPTVDLVAGGVSAGQEVIVTP